MNELIRINNDSDRPTVMGRELHEALEVKTRYNDWFKRMCEYGFTENSDFVALTQKRVTAQGNEITETDHQLTIDMAKELCMIQRSEIGRKCRQYFIDVEKQWNTPEAVMDRALRYANQRIKQLEQEKANTPISAHQLGMLRTEIQIKAIDLCGSGRIYSNVWIKVEKAIRNKICETMNTDDIEKVVVWQFDTALEICRQYKPDAKIRELINSQRLLLKSRKGA